MELSMRILQVQIINKGYQKIKIRFDFMIPEKKSLFNVREIDEVSFPDFSMEFRSKYGHTATAQLSVEKEPFFYDFFDKDKTQFNQASIIYYLPTRFTSAVYVIQKLVSFIRENSLKATHFLINNESIYESLSYDETSSDTDSVQGVEEMEMSMKERVEKGFQSPKHLVVNFIEKIMKLSAKVMPNGDFSKFIRLYYHAECAYVFKDQGAYMRQKMQLKILGWELLHKAPKFELEAMLETLRIQAVEHLYSSAIGEPTYNQRYYSWSDSEYQFLQQASAKFVLKKELLTIHDIRDIPAYYQFYREDFGSENCLNEELSTLGKVIGLQFEHLSNNKIVFNKESTARLVNVNLHLMNIPALKKERKAKSSSPLLQRSTEQTLVNSDFFSNLATNKLPQVTSNNSEEKPELFDPGFFKNPVRKQPLTTKSQDRQLIFNIWNG
jgi:hypothetical protein